MDCHRTKKSNLPLWIDLNLPKSFQRLLAVIEFSFTIQATKQDAHQHRWQTAVKDRAFIPLLSRTIIETPGELLLKVMQCGKVSTNVYLRRLHNFCADMNWLPCGCETQTDRGGGRDQRGE